MLSKMFFQYTSHQNYEALLLMPIGYIKENIVFFSLCLIPCLESLFDFSTFLNTICFIWYNWFRTSSTFNCSGTAVFFLLYHQIVLFVHTIYDSSIKIGNVPCSKFWNHSLVDNNMFSCCSKAMPAFLEYSN